jgi:tripartite-type tricarboxylate transporter receptor subunit TctC
LGRPFFMPPSTPLERAAAGRRAFAATMKDPAFLDEAKRAQLDVAPLTGEQMQQIVATSFAVSPSALAISKTAME